MEFVDYYKVLEVPRDAKPEEITKAYRRLARKHHPDVCKDPGAEEQFKRINEAHQVLSDPEKRKRYDLLGPDWRDGQPFQPPPGWTQGAPFEYRTYGGGGGGGGDWSDFFEAFFGGGGARPRGGGRRSAGRGPRVHVATSGFPGGAAEPLDPDLEDLMGGMFGGTRGRPRARRGGDIEGELELSLEDALRGGTRTVQLADGEGSCRTYEIRIPAGVHDGARIRLGGRGRPGRSGAEAGDLLLTIRLRPHADFRRDGDELVVAVPVAPWEAALGASVRVRTPDGPVEMKLPPGRSSGDRLRLRGKGLPLRDGGRGDLLAEVRIVLPARLDERERKLFEQLREASEFKPRGE
ncbi:MAG: DnaJ domain-containing protein [Deltaproteobacteria bacterium]|nr:DnaJ domain-containing protein [Deltaproteobacteria bacterium]